MLFMGLAKRCTAFGSQITLFGNRCVTRSICRIDRKSWDTVPPYGGGGNGRHRVGGKNIFGKGEVLIARAVVVIWDREKAAREGRDERISGLRYPRGGGGLLLSLTEERFGTSGGKEKKHTYPL